jgi:hypothetical protein
MKRAILVVCCVFLAVALAAMLAKIAPIRTRFWPTAKPQPLSQAESFEFLASLNRAEKIFPESYPLPLRGYMEGDLKAENCFGVRLANGLRLVGESSGSTYGVREHGEQVPSVLIGVLHPEFPFAIDDQPLPAGPYIVQVGQDALELRGNHESKTHYDSIRGKLVPDQVTKMFPLKVTLPEALLAEKAKEIPRFSLAVEKGAIVLTLHGNTWTLVPRQ